MPKMLVRRDIRLMVPNERVFAPANTPVCCRFPVNTDVQCSESRARPSAALRCGVSFASRQGVNSGER